MNNKLRIVLDTNVFLVSLLPSHKYWWVFEGIISQRYILLLSNEILMEYTEKCIGKYGVSLVNERLDFLLGFSNVELIAPTYFWNFIVQDPDDNKFIDCVVTGQADFIITHDKHFNVLKSIPFPKLSAIKLDEFKFLLDQ
jgi:putative PIN family toxin of toxin-antitoxin system